LDTKDGIYKNEEVRIQKDAEEVED